MPKLLTVVGGTGTQGLSLIDEALRDGSYKIRALTRTPSSDKAKKLASQGVEVVRADLNDEGSLSRAFEGSNAIFAMTDFFEPFATHGPEIALETEVAQGINLAKAASKTSTLEHYIWSTLPNSRKLTNGKYIVPHFEGKNRIEDYIKQDSVLFSKTTFLWISFYGNNYQYPIYTPNFMKTSGTYVQLSPAAPDVPRYLIGDPRANIGIFAFAILKNPQKTLPGQYVFAYTEVINSGRLLEEWTEATGKPSKYVQTSLEHFSNVWPMWGEEMGIMMKAWDELREKSWTGESPLITKEDLGIADRKFVSTKDSMKAMDWSALL